MLNHLYCSLLPLFATGGGSGWSIDSLLGNIQAKLADWGGLIIMIIGAVMLISAAWKIGSGLMSHGKKQTNWAVCIILILVGGAFLAGGWSFIQNISESGQQIIEDLGTF